MRLVVWGLILVAAAGCQRGLEPKGAALAEERDAAAAPTPTAVEVDAGATPGAAKQPAVDAGPARPWPPPLQRADTDWCIDSVATLDEETCVVFPERPSDHLLIYLHGIVPPTKTSVQKTNFETVVERASKRANVVALIPRGERGFAPKGHAGWWGWPTSKSSFASKGEPFLRKLRDKRKKLEDAVGRPFEKTFLAGSSSGAYFVVALALHGAFPADGYGAMSGGTGYDTTELPGLSPRPFYIGFGAHDPVSGAARALGDRLRRAGWPVLLRAHPTGHGAREIYLDEAFEFWIKDPAPGSSEKSRSG